MYNLDKLAVYVDNKGGKTSVDTPTNLCGFISRYEGERYSVERMMRNVLKGEC